MTADGPLIYESWIERRLREAAEQGEFDDLEGSGEPLAILEEPYEPTWWIKRWIEREGITAAEVHRSPSSWREVDSGV